MKESDALRALEDQRRPGDAVFSLMREKKRSFFQQFLDMVVTTGLAGGTKDLLDNTQAPFFLVGDNAAATIFRVRDGQVVESRPVNDWTGVDAFRKADVDGYTYRKVARVA